MKSFKEYLMESKRVYEFKVKIAGDLPKDCASLIKSAMGQFKVESCSGGKSAPIQETQADFPGLKNLGVTTFDVSCSYPATSEQVRDKIAETVKVALANIRVRTIGEENEYSINHEFDEKSGKALLGTDYPKDSSEDLAGEQYNLSFLKELGKQPRKTGTEYTGVNDELLAKGAPKHVKETPGKQPAASKTNFKNLFTKQIKVPTAKGATK